MSAKRSPPARWRKAVNPDKGTRWDTAVNRSLWQRDHGQDLELWRDGRKLATVTRVRGGWQWRLLRAPGSRPEFAASRDEAKKAAREAAIG